MNLAPTLPQNPERVVSLVPSMTESLFELGMGRRVVAITDYCVHPADALSGLPRIGGTKDPNLEAILRLKPDLVIANQEENTQSSVVALQEARVPVWVTFPQSVEAALEDLRTVASLFASSSALRKVETLERSVEWTRRACESGSLRVFCPIWRGGSAAHPEWWMTFNQETFAHDLLRVCGGENVFANRERRFPLKADLGEADERDVPGRDRRYPRVGLEEVRETSPDVILLPDEPFAFGEEDAGALRDLLPETPAVGQDRILPIEGSLLFWHGTRIGKALQALPGLLRSK